MCIAKWYLLKIINISVTRGDLSQALEIYLATYYRFVLVASTCCDPGVEFRATAH